MMTGRRKNKRNKFNFGDFLPKSNRHLLGIKHRIEDLIAAREALPSDSHAVRILNSEIKKLELDQGKYAERMREFLAIHWVVGHYDPDDIEEGFQPLSYELSGRRDDLIREAIKRFRLGCDISTFRKWLNRANTPNTASNFTLG